jgi:heme oxygenase
MARLFDADYTISEYRAHLGYLLGLFEPLERAVSEVSGPGDPAAVVHRSSDLREDLRIMGATASDIDGLERCPKVPPISRSGARGYTYVILGSLLGGRIIVKRLRAVLGPGASFLFYGDGRGHYEAAWASFCKDLEENGKNDVEAICATAVAVFDAYGSWLSEPLVLAGSR